MSQVSFGARRPATISVSIQVRQWIALPLLIVLLAWYVAAPSVTVAILLATVVVMIVFSFIWARQLALRLRGQRILESAAMQVGDELEEQVSLTNQSPLPVLWVELADRSNLPGYVVSGVRGVGSASSTNWRAHTICKQRGVYNLGPWELRTGDPFGLFEVTQVYLQRQEILVYPPLAAIPPDLMPHRGAQGDHRPLRQPVQAETIDSMSVRAYQPSDPLRHIHWPTTARIGVPYVKVFEPQAASRVWLIPDMDPAAQWGEAEDSTEETSVLLCASLAAHLLQDKLAAGIFAGGDPPAVVTPQRGTLHLWRILEQLAPLTPAPRRESGALAGANPTRADPARLAGVNHGCAARGLDSQPEARIARAERDQRARLAPGSGFFWRDRERICLSPCVGGSWVWKVK